MTAHTTNEASGPSRRSILLGGGASLLALPAMPAWSAARRPRRVALRNLNTGDFVNVVYWADGNYVGDAMVAINHVMRDHHSGDVGKIDPRLIDILYRIRVRARSRRAWEIISGYRAPATNKALQGKIRGVATDSLHTQGRAADVRLPGRPLHGLRRIALMTRAGGVGLYPDSAFAHLDTGPVRYWIGRGRRRSSLAPHELGCPCCGGAVATV